ncbi:hypothetical protein TUM4438_05380 [Shewanella sairae]|uniref:Secreted protein n=1 Tax=Shewanella sairae TaxID=190310 RepID=A0ABQ4P1I6_9GAMM|nr:hypothetical protein [Shewanella sairae]MCL1129706.1 hypothetical protein [Shewanella sairae]GIU41376.1 hypothetical protein TUM4438_05380 [Shewanella sairae]
MSLFSLSSAVLRFAAGVLFVVAMPSLANSLTNDTLNENFLNEQTASHNASNYVKANVAGKMPQQLAIFEQTFNFSLPTDWKLAYSAQQETMYSAEFLPADQELQNWSTMVCVQGFKGVAEDIEPELFLETMANVYLESCQGEMVFESLPSEPLNGHETASAIIGCTKMPNSHIKAIDSTTAYEANHGLGEIGHYTAVKGKSDLYLIHKSMRGDSFSQTNPPLKAQNYQEFLSSITPLSLH